jgi:hypothetical protein
VWVGWQISIARLGLAELTSLVETAFQARLRRFVVDSLRAFPR